ncbi:hypothetical protein AA0229_2351 [Gluconobacter cerinus NRIC 0229]|uniref:Uncharacterized protein n=1 Tax=Gluconobacter cerinus TaxID=38307 RepID=A0AAV5NDF8_9PROT|nr:hypothetical protein AA0229_2351 [Gluconobacter cerinus NRIC 0229]GLQ62459.1 hypothetical protein GCM10007867_13040 [Gluconobacter cerinus]
MGIEDLRCRFGAVHFLKGNEICVQVGRVLMQPNEVAGFATMNIIRECWISRLAKGEPVQIPG